MLTYFRIGRERPGPPLPFARPLCVSSGSVLERQSRTGLPAPLWPPFLFLFCIQSAYREGELRQTGHKTTDFLTDSSWWLSEKLRECILGSQRIYLGVALASSSLLWDCWEASSRPLSPHPIFVPCPHFSAALSLSRPHSWCVQRWLCSAGKPLLRLLHDLRQSIPPGRHPEGPQRPFLPAHVPGRKLPSAEGHRGSLYFISADLCRWACFPAGLCRWRERRKPFWIAVCAGPCSGGPGSQGAARGPEDRIRSCLRAWKRLTRDWAQMSF